MENQKVSLHKYLTLCLEYNKAPSDELEAEIKSMISAIQVKNYMPLTDKTVAAMKILSLALDEMDAPGVAMQLEMGRIYLGLFKYAVNLDVDINVITQKATAALDLCYEHGLVDYILQYCGPDYQRLCDYISSMDNIDRIRHLIQTASLMNETNFKEWKNTLKEAKTLFTPEFLATIEKLNLASTDGAFDQISKELAKNSVEEVNRALREKEETMTKIVKDAAGE